MTSPVFFTAVSGCLYERKSYRPITGLQTFQQYSGFFSGGGDIKMRRILHELVGGTPRHVSSIFRSKKQNM